MFEEILSPSIHVEAVDTTGAGDVFHAGFLFALLEGLPFREILAFANAAAGLSYRGMGGRAAIPAIGAIRAAAVSPGTFPGGPEFRQSILGTSGRSGCSGAALFDQDAFLILTFVSLSNICPR